MRMVLPITLPHCGPSIGLKITTECVFSIADEPPRPRNQAPPDRMRGAGTARSRRGLLWGFDPLLKGCSPGPVTPQRPVKKSLTPIWTRPDGIRHDFRSPSASWSTAATVPHIQRASSDAQAPGLLSASSAFRERRCTGKRACSYGHNAALPLCIGPDIPAQNFSADIEFAASIRDQASRVQASRVQTASAHANSRESMER